MVEQQYIDGLPAVNKTEVQMVG